MSAVLCKCHLAIIHCSFAGDLLNIIANENGTAVMSYDDHLIKLNGPISVIGKTFVVSII